MAFYYDGTGTDPWHLRAQTSVTWVISGIYEHEQKQKYFSLLTCKIPHKVGEIVVTLGLYTTDVSPEDSGRALR